MLITKEKQAIVHSDPPAVTDALPWSSAVTNTVRISAPVWANPVTQQWNQEARQIINNLRLNRCHGARASV